MKHLRNAAVLSVALLLQGAQVQAEIALDESFVRELDDAGLTFHETLLSDYKATAITENDHMSYELAVTRENPRLEIRYAIRNFDEPPREATAKPEAVAKALFITTVLNVARRESDIFDSSPFEKSSVKREFNADWGASAMLMPKKEFAGKFDRCTFVFISKNSRSAYIFYLFNEGSRREVAKEMGNVFYALRFR